MTLARAIPPLLLALALAGSAGAAPGGPSALKGHDTKAPIDLKADRLEAQDRADRAVFDGNVEVRQGDLTMNTARLTLAYTNGSGIDVRRIDASGGVVVTSPSERARGDFGTYDLDRKLITLVGNVQLSREGSTLGGGRLTLDLDSGRAVIDGGARGSGEGGGRVTGHFLVNQKKK